MKVHHLNCGTMDAPGADIVCHVLLVETDNGLVLVDSGFGLRDCADPTRIGPSRHLLRPIFDVNETAARQVTESRNKRIADSARAVWEHSLGVAILARDLAALAQAEAPDAAFLAGLLHDVGKPLIAGMLLEVERQMGSGRNALDMSAEDWQRAVADCHRPIGEALAAKWALPRSVARCIKDVTEYDAADRGSPVNFVVFANALAKRCGLYPGHFDAEEVGALELIGRSMLGLQDDVVARLAGGLAERVRGQLT